MITVQRWPGIVLFTILLRFATGGGAEETSASAIFQLLVVEGVGGIVLGLATGYLAYWGMRLIDDYPVEVLISLALVTGTYAVAQRLHVSGPLAAMVRGRPADRGSWAALRDEQPHADLPVRAVDGDRRGTELCALPADRVGGAGT